MADKIKTRDCPYCKEEIRADAVKCKHCHSNIKPEHPDHEGTCPYCKEEIKKDAIKCKHCKSRLDRTTAKCDCSCSDRPVESYMAYRRAIARGGFKDEYGQGCFYDCIDEHVGHGDDQNDPDLHRYCERKCRVSMPAPGNHGIMYRWY